ncbi:polysaccharide pyruvyl transferase family protein [Bifidobacterium felsineum]|uniref:Polysaccharide pyruvyl transferase domain-containing protein n=1 Tax=Bifidobacterium felsineum TaxID=2045440 RepID=A0A2M9HHT8_9BIFI|nr:polysaccharide pyruvyl transferase family protein [Bifidobacterium felsineum]PJM76398.1 hypothetical protein CSQ86_09515 [Bifidobacterium felsineum]
MNIGIITWFDYENYGTKLQAVALQRYLRNLGHNVQLVNFKLDDSKSSTSLDTRSLVRKIHDKAKYLLLQAAKKKYVADFAARSDSFRNTITSSCMLTQHITDESTYIEVCNQFDALIFGSDQIWNPNWFHKYYYADYDAITTPRIAYAPSIGVKTIPVNHAEDYIRCLSRFKALSLREQSACDCISQLIGRDATLVVDPTMLINVKDWSKFAGSKRDAKPYVLCYFLSDNRNHWKAACRYAREHNLQLKIIPQTGLAYYQSGDIEASAGVEDFVRFIRDAEYVITDSFHASVFSIIFSKPFTVFERFNPANPKAQNTRIYNLLDLSNLKSDLQAFNSSRIDNSPQLMTSSNMNSQLTRLIAESKQYLDLSLNTAR